MDVSHQDVLGCLTPAWPYQVGYALRNLDPSWRKAARGAQLEAVTAVVDALLAAGATVVPEEWVVHGGAVRTATTDLARRLRPAAAKLVQQVSRRCVKPAA